MKHAVKGSLSSAALAQIQARVRFADMRTAAAAAAAAAAARASPPLSVGPAPAATPAAAAPVGSCGARGCDDERDDAAEFAPPHLGRAILAAHDALDACPELRALLAWVDALRAREGDRTAPTDLDLTNGVALLRAMAIVAPGALATLSDNAGPSAVAARNKAVEECTSRSAVNGGGNPRGGGAETQLDEDGHVARRNIARLCRALDHFPWTDPDTKLPLPSIDFENVEPWALGAFVVLAALSGPDADMYFDQINASSEDQRNLMDDLLTKAVAALREALPASDLVTNVPNRNLDNHANQQHAVCRDDKKPASCAYWGQEQHDLQHKGKIDKNATRPPSALTTDSRIAPSPEHALISKGELPHQPIALAHAVKSSGLNSDPQNRQQLGSLVLVPESDLIAPRLCGLRESQGISENEAGASKRPEIACKAVNPNALPGPKLAELTFRSKSDICLSPFRKLQGRQLKRDSPGGNRFDQNDVTRIGWSAAILPRISELVPIKPDIDSAVELGRTRVVDHTIVQTESQEQKSTVQRTSDNTPHRNVDLVVDQERMERQSLTRDEHQNRPGPESLLAVSENLQRRIQPGIVFQSQSDPASLRQAELAALKLVRELDLDMNIQSIENEQCRAAVFDVEVCSAGKLGENMSENLKESAPSLEIGSPVDRSGSADLRYLGNAGDGKSSTMAGSEPSGVCSEPETLGEWKEHAAKLAAELESAQQRSREWAEHAASLQRLAADLSCKLESARKLIAQSHGGSSDGATTDADATAAATGAAAAAVTPHASQRLSRRQDVATEHAVSSPAARAELAGKQRENVALRRRLLVAEKHSAALERELERVRRELDRSKTVSGQAPMPWTACSPAHRRGLPR